MDMLSKTDNHNRLKVFFTMLVISFLIETVIFNMRFFQSLFYDEVPLGTSNSLRIENAHINEEGFLELDEGADEFTLTVENIDLALENVRLDMETANENVSPEYEDNVCRVAVFVQDEALREDMGEDGNTFLNEGMYRVTEKKVLHNIPASQYFWLAAFGNVKTLKFRISSLSGVARSFQINDIRFNAREKMNISPCRLLIIFIVLVVVYYTLLDTSFLSADCITYAKWKYILPSVLLFLLLVVAFFWSAANPGNMISRVNEYGLLAKSLVNGDVSVGEASEFVKNSQDYTVSWNPMSFETMFDYAYYNGKYYVYFGVLPCIVFFVPYLLITGKTLTVFVPVVIMCVTIVAEIYILLGMLIRRYFRGTKYVLRLLMTGAAFSGMYMPLFISIPDHYLIAISSGVALLLGGAMFWIRAFSPVEPELVEIEGKHKGKISPWFIAVGSLCMAAVSLCRPTLLLPGFVMLILLVISHSRDIKKMDYKSITACILAVMVPYAIFAILCMYYNYIRFDSVFDFGVTKNLTTIPPGMKTGYAPYLIAYTIYEYLFAPAEFASAYPFLKYQRWKQLAEGSSILGITKPEIGLFVGTPVLLCGLLCITFRKELKRKGLILYLVAMLACSLFLMCFSTVFTSCIADRYSLEFSLFFFIPAFAGIMQLLESMDRDCENRLKEAVYFVVRLLLVTAVLYGLFQIIPEKGLYSLSSGNTELYYSIYYGINFML